MLTMSNIADCLNKRYQIFDELIKELGNQNGDNINENAISVNRIPSSNTVAIKLMCDLWKILKENPDCDVSHLVRHRMASKTSSETIKVVNNYCSDSMNQVSSVFKPIKFQCYMADTPKKMGEGSNSREIFEKVKSACCQDDKNQPDQKPKCCSSKSMSPSASDALPLSKVLCNLKEAASFDRKCSAKLAQLLETEKQLQTQILHLEHREKEGLALLKQADCMWTCMEDAYKKKITETVARQKEVAGKLAEIDKSTSKWRQNKKELEIQMDSIYKCNNEIFEKLNQKSNDLKFTNAEIESFTKKIEAVKTDTEAVKKSFNLKKQASAKNVLYIVSRIKKFEKELAEEKGKRSKKEYEGEKFLKAARDDIVKLNKVLLKKQLESQDIKSEIESTNREIDMLRDALDSCQLNCNSKRDTLKQELAKVHNEIRAFKVKCIQCHQCSSTVDFIKFCSDCPRCVQVRDCLYDKESCYLDHVEDCICMTVKKKFLNNVFENMYTVLERQIKTGAGRCVAESVIQSLKRSTNGKLDAATRKILQDFILTTIRKNLNLTIVGGAIKTRCEMDADTYKQLMLCLKQIKVLPISKADKSTAKKEACLRWGGECNCPRGPKECICNVRGPRPSRLPRSSPPTPPDKEDLALAKACPHKDGPPCGIDCGAHAPPETLPSSSKAPPPELWKPAPCKEKSCPFSNNMRAAQCVLGSESLRTKGLSPSLSDDMLSTTLESIEEIEKNCTCDGQVDPLCPYHGDYAFQPRKRIIDEVMGEYDQYELENIDNVSVQPNYSFISYDSIDMNKS